MTREEIDGMAAGMRLNELVAEKVTKELTLGFAPPYSTNIAAAYSILGKFERWQLMSMPDGIYAKVNISTKTVQSFGYCLDQSAAVAICKAALFATVELENVAEDFAK